MWRTPAATASRTKRTCSRAVVRRLVPRPMRGHLDAGELERVHPFHPRTDPAGAASRTRPRGVAPRADACSPPPEGGRAVGGFSHRTNPPGDQMNSLLHITHANAVSAERLAVRRNRRWSK